MNFWSPSEAASITISLPTFASNTNLAQILQIAIELTSWLPKQRIALANILALSAFNSQTNLKQHNCVKFWYAWIEGKNKILDFNPMFSLIDCLHVFKKQFINIYIDKYSRRLGDNDCWFYAMWSMQWLWDRIFRQTSSLLSNRLNVNNG